MRDEGIIGDDNRVVVTEQMVAAYPYCLIGQTYSTFNNRLNNKAREGYGTGYLIAKDLVLTVAHNIYIQDAANKGMPSQFTFKLGLCKKKAIYYTVVNN